MCYLHIMKSTKIFVVDDDLFNLNSYRQVLDALGYKSVSLFLNVTICLSKLYQKPNIVFLSHKKDEILDLDTLKKIKRYNSDIYVIIISSQENIKIANETLTHGAFDYIIKDENEIYKIRKVIERIYGIGK